MRLFSNLEADSLVLYLAFGLYLANMLVGIVAQLRWWHFGKAHHVLYFAVCVSTLGAIILHFHPALIVTAIALALMPKSRPWTWKHPVCAVSGLIGYIWVVVFS